MTPLDSAGPKIGG